MEENEKSSAALKEACRDLEPMLRMLLTTETDLEGDKNRVRTRRKIARWMKDPARTPEEIFYMIDPFFQSIQGNPPSAGFIPQSALAIVTLEHLAQPQQHQQQQQQQQQPQQQQQQHQQPQQQQQQHQQHHHQQHHHQQIIDPSRNPKVIEGCWEFILWMCTKYLETTSRLWCPYPLKYFVSASLNWLCDPALCPNPYLRLEMLRLILLFEFEFEYGDAQWSYVLEGFIDTMCDINVEHLETKGLELVLNACDLIELFEILQNKNLLPFIGEKIMSQLNENKKGREVLFLANVFELLGKLAIMELKIVKSQHFINNKLKDMEPMEVIKYPLNCLKSTFRFLLELLSLLFQDRIAMLSTACQHPLLAPSVSTAIADISAAVINLESLICSFNFNPIITQKLLQLPMMELREKLVKYFCVPSNEKTLHVKLLQREHGGYKKNFMHSFSNSLYHTRNLQMTTYTCPMQYPNTYDRSDVSDDLTELSNNEINPNRAEITGNNEINDDNGDINRLYDDLVYLLDDEYDVTMHTDVERLGEESGVSESAESGSEVSNVTPNNDLSSSDNSDEGSISDSLSSSSDESDNNNVEENSQNPTQISTGDRQQYTSREMIYDNT